MVSFYKINFCLYRVFVAVLAFYSCSSWISHWGGLQALDLQGQWLWCMWLLDPGDALRQVRSLQVQSFSHVWFFLTPWIAACQASLSITNSQSLLKFKPIESVMPFSHLIFCLSFSSCPQTLPASGSFPVTQLFASGGQVLEFQLQHQSFQWTLRTDLFKIDWLDLLTIQGTLKSFFQHHSSKTSILQCSAFFTV